MKKKKAALGIVIGIAVMAIIATAVFLVINLTKRNLTFVSGPKNSSAHCCNVPFKSANVIPLSTTSPST